MNRLIRYRPFANMNNQNTTSSSYYFKMVRQPGTEKEYRNYHAVPVRTLFETVEQDYRVAMLISAGQTIEFIKLSTINEEIHGVSNEDLPKLPDDVVQESVITVENMFGYDNAFYIRISEQNVDTSPSGPEIIEELQNNYRYSITSNSVLETTYIQHEYNNLIHIIPADAEEVVAEEPGAEEEEEVDDSICGVCLESPQFRFPFYDCSHCFCLSCTRRWSRINQSCPLCRREGISLQHLDSVREINGYMVIV